MLAEPPKEKKREKKQDREDVSFASTKNRKVKLALALATALSLLTLYLYFLNIFYPSLILAPMSALESAIFYTMILRALGFSFVPFLRKLHPQVKILVFSIEAFVLCILIVAFIFTGGQVYNSLMSNTLTAWIGATLIVLTPYSFFELALMMYRGASITALFVSSAPLIAISLFLSNLVSRNPTFPNGIEDFGKDIVDTLRVQPGLAGAGNSGGTASLVTSFASVIFFVSIVIYVAFTLNESAPALSNTPKYHYAFALMLVGSLFSYIWVSGAASFLRGNIIEVLSVPSILIPVILWVITRRGH